MNQASKAAEATRKVLVVIPAYNEAEGLPLVLEDLREHVPSIAVLVVDDGSQDATAQVAVQGGALVLRNECNTGIGATLKRGFQYALEKGYQAMVRLDADGQHRAEYVPQLLEQLAEGADLVVGSRFLEGPGYSIGWLRRLAMGFLSKLVSVAARFPLTDCSSGFRAYTRRTLELLARRYVRDYPEPVALVTCAKAGLKIVETPVKMRPRQAGKSSISGLRGVWYVLKVSCLVLAERFRPIRPSPAPVTSGLEEKPPC